MSDDAVEIADELDEDFEYSLASDKPFSDILDSDRERIAKIRENLFDILPKCPDYDDDYNILRWLQGYDNDVVAVSKAIRNHLRFYLAWDLKNICNEKRNEVLKKYYPYGLFPHTISDNDNSLLFIECLGRLDSDSILKVASSIEILRDRVHGAELSLRAIRAQEQRTGRQAYMFYICDLEGLKTDYQSLLSSVSGPYRLLCEFFISHYAEMFSKYIVINAPSFFSYLWAVLAPLLPQKTRDKITIFSADNPQLWKAELLKYIDPERLPVHWGGRFRDPNGDPMCRSIVTVPPDDGIPKDAHWVPMATDVIPELELQIASVFAGKCEFVDVFIDLGQSKVKFIDWYYTADSNHSFGIFYSSTDCNPNEIASRGQEEVCAVLERMEMVFPHFAGLTGPSQVPEKGQIKCVKTGYYKFKFGNEMAWWWQTLTIKYNMRIL